MNKARSPIAKPTGRLVLPVSHHRYLYLEGPFPLTADEYDRLLYLLDVMRPGMCFPVATEEARNQVPDLPATIADETMMSLDANASITDGPQAEGGES